MQPSLTFWLLIGIILVLVYVMVVPKIGSVGSTRSPFVAANSDLHGGIKTALDAFRIDNGFYPKGFNDLMQRTDEAKSWHGPYLEKLPIDPWGNPYIYYYPSKHNLNTYDLLSAGPDGKEGTDDDIGNW